MVGRRWGDNHRFQALSGIGDSSHFLPCRSAAVDAHTISHADNITMLVGLALPSNYEYQRAGAALLLKDVHDLELPGNPIARVSRAQKLPIAATIQAVAVEG